MDAAGAAPTASTAAAAAAAATAAVATAPPKRSRFLEAFGEIVEPRHYAPRARTPAAPAAPEAAPAARGPPPSIPKSRAVVVCHERQRGNPVTGLIRHAAVEYTSNSTADFELSDTTVALFLSVQYAKLHPTYLWSRIEGLKRCRLRVLLVLVDDQDAEQALLRVQTLAVANGLTVVVAFSPEEAARYLETYAIMKNKSAEGLQGKKDSDLLAVVSDALTQIKAVNKSDVKTLLRNFDGSLVGVFAAKMEELALCEGIGGKKVLQLHAAFNEPFFRAPAAPSSPPPASTAPAAEGGGAGAPAARAGGDLERADAEDLDDDGALEASDADDDLDEDDDARARDDGNHDE